MNILSGIYTPDSGEILLDGKPIKFHSPADSIRAGIGMVHQHFKLVEVLSAKENIVAGQKSQFWLRDKALSEEIRALAERYTLNNDPDKKSSRWRSAKNRQYRSLRCCTAVRRC
jgi:simple sugar transport system ATP-binding protein